MNLAIPNQRVFIKHSHLGVDDPTPIAGNWYGLTLIQAQLVLCHVMFDNGANWARLPLHWLRTNKEAVNKDITPGEAARWDCFSYEGDITRFPFLRNQMADLVDIGIAGRYLFSLDYFDSKGQAPFAESPEQHKQHHFFDCDDGIIRARPNNYLRWTDKALYDPYEEVPRYQRVFDMYWAEGEEE